AGLSREPADQQPRNQALHRRADDDSDNPGTDVRVVAGGHKGRETIGDSEKAAEEHAKYGFLHCSSWQDRKKGTGEPGTESPIQFNVAVQSFNGRTRRGTSGA